MEINNRENPHDFNPLRLIWYPVKFYYCSNPAGPQSEYVKSGLHNILAVEAIFVSFRKRWNSVDRENLTKKHVPG